MAPPGSKSKILGGDGSKFEISQAAYVKLVLHALKHKTSSVNGVLIGRVTGQGTLQEGAEGNGSVEVVDAVPLFHGQLGLLPMLELALTQVDAYLQIQNDDLAIVGYYHGNELLDDTEVNSIARKIGDKIAQYCPEAIILLLDHGLLGSLTTRSKTKPVTQLFVRDSAKGWHISGELQLKEATANGILLDYISEGREHLVVDFDEHLDDVAKDWLNPQLFA